LAAVLVAKPTAADIAPPGGTARPSLEIAPLGGAGRASLAVAPPAGAARPSLYGVTSQGSLGLVRVDRDTLRPLAGHRVPLAAEPLGWSFSPDRSRIALGSTARGARLRLIDLRAMRALGDVTITRRGSGVATAWAGPRRVLAVIVTPGCCGAGDTIVAGIDAVRRRVVWRRRLGGSLQAGDRFGRGLLLVLGPRGRSIGPSRLIRVGPRGQMRSAALPEIHSGSEPKGSVTRTWSPGLAVDRRGRRAFVVQAGAPVAEVDLPSFGVSSHALQPRAADAVAGPTRRALWLGRGLLAVTGSDARSGGRETPAGLTLVDTRRWRARMVDPRTTDARVVSGTLLASSFLNGGRSGSGLTGYSLDGMPKFHLFGNDQILGAQPIGRNALVGGPRGIALIDARTGRRLRHYRRFSMSLLSEDAPVFY
jgi:hypothetical protein